MWGQLELATLSHQGSSLVVSFPPVSAKDKLSSPCLLQQHVILGMSFPRLCHDLIFSRGLNTSSEFLVFLAGICVASLSCLVTVVSSFAFTQTWVQFSPHHEQLTISLVSCSNASLSFPLSKMRYRCPSQRVSQRAGGLRTVQRLSVSVSLCIGCKIMCGEHGPPPNSEASKTMSSQSPNTWQHL